MVAWGTSASAGWRRSAWLSWMTCHFVTLTSDALAAKPSERRGSRLRREPLPSAALQQLLPHIKGTRLRVSGMHHGERTAWRESFWWLLKAQRGTRKMKTSALLQAPATSSNAYDWTAPTPPEQSTLTLGFTRQRRRVSRNLFWGAQCCSGCLCWPAYSRSSDIPILTFQLQHH